MRHKSLWLAGLTGLLMLAVTVTQARALRIAPPPGQARVASADLIILGKVTGYGPKLIKAEQFKDDNRDMKIAIVKVDQALLGKAGKEVKVGFVVPTPRKEGDPKIGRPIPGRNPSVQLTQDQEVCVFLVKHPKHKDVYVVSNYYDVIAKTGNPNFASEIDEVKAATKLLAKPMDGLKSKNADDRYLTAALLISRYRTAKAGSTKTEEIPADESKLILQALAEAEWNPRNTKINYQLQPQAMFFRLGLTPQDGWKVKNFRNIAEEAKTWLKDNAGKYRIKRYVAETKAEK